jgi:hypothetical protein
MSDKKTGQPRGFGFVAMKDPAACDIIVTTGNSYTYSFIFSLGYSHISSRAYY